MAVVHGMPSPGRRGYRTFVPPPEGCVGWARQQEAARDASPSRLRNGLDGGATRNRSLSPAAPSEAGARSARTRPASPRSASRNSSFTPDKSEARRSSGGRSQSPAYPDDRRSASRASKALEASLGTLPELSATAGGLRPPTALERLQQDLQPRHLGPAQDVGHMKAAATANLGALRDADVRLRDALDGDAGLLEEPAGDAAFKLYCSSLAAFEPSPGLQRLAFQCVVGDDHIALADLLASGKVLWNTQNAGGQTLLEVAYERQKPQTLELLKAAKKRSQELPPPLKGVPKKQSLRP